MRKVLAGLTILAAALVVAPASTATSAPDTRAEPAVEQSRQVGTAATLKNRIVTLVNNRRQNRGCPPLRRNAALGRAAQKHSRRMAAAGVLTHQLPGEPPYTARIRREGYNYRGAAENVSAWPTPRRTVQEWMQSSGHRRNILNCRYRHTGVGYALSNRGTAYWTQVYAYR